MTSNRIADEKTVYYGIIADGVHTHPAALRIAYRTHKDGLILVTDAISAFGLQDGIHFIGQMAIKVSGDKAFIAGTDTLCGSIAPMDECIRIFQKSTGKINVFFSFPTINSISVCSISFSMTNILDCSIVYALEAASYHPAKCLNIDKQKGTLNFGADGDFVLLNDDLIVQSTWIAGKCVYDSNRK